MKLFDNSKMVIKLIIMAIVVGLFPLLLSNVLLAKRQKTLSKGYLMDESQIVAENIAKEFNSYIQQAEDEINILAKDVMIQEFLINDGQGTYTYPILREALAARIPDTMEMLHFTDMMIVDKDGNLLIQYSVPSIDGKKYPATGSAQVKGVLDNKVVTWEYGLKKQQQKAEDGSIKEVEIAGLAVAAPVFKDGRFIGIINFTANVDAVRTIVTEEKTNDKGEKEYGITKLGKSANTFLVDSSGVIYTNMMDPLPTGDIMHTKIETEGVTKLAAAIHSKSSVEPFLYLNNKGTTVLGAFAKVNVGSNTYGLVMEVNEEEAYAGLSSQTQTIMIFVILFVLFDLAVTLLFTSRIVRPLNNIVVFAEGIKDYHLNDDIDKDTVARTDEIGKVAKAIQDIQKSLRALVEKIASSSEELLTASRQLQESAGQSSVASSEVAHTISEIANGATDQAATTVEGANKLKALGERVEAETEAIGLVDSQMENVEANVHEGMEIIEDLFNKNKLSTEASKIVKESINLASACAKKISEASTFIASIASQTNLLSLNASIEAARAGEAGRGFSVVASEIQKLADQSTESTKTIDAIVVEIVKAVETAVQKSEESEKILDEQTLIVQTASDKFKHIFEATRESKEAVEELEKSSDVISDTNKEVQDAINGLASIAEENAASTQETQAAVEEQAAMVSEISDESGHLADLAQELKDIIARFDI